MQIDLKINTYSYTAPDEGKTPKISGDKKTIDSSQASVSKKKRILSAMMKVLLVSACIGAGALFIRKKSFEESTRAEDVRQIKIITEKIKNRYNSPLFKKHSTPKKDESINRSLEIILNSYSSTAKKTEFNENIEKLAKLGENGSHGHTREILGNLFDIADSLDLSPVGIKNPSLHELVTDCTTSEGHFTPEHLAKLYPAESDKWNCYDFKRLYNITCLQKVGDKDFENLFK